jgi:hypothetical protein
MPRRRQKSEKKYTTKSYYCDNIDQPKRHLMAFLLLYNQRPLKALTYKTPYATLGQWFERKPILFKADPSQKILGLNMIILEEET